jgi:FKBP-type peptidyl-prolyl cis-trans isomerase
MLGAGDKAEFILSIDSLKKWGALPADDKFFKKGGTIKGKLEIVKVFTVDSLARADYDAEFKVASAKKEEEKKTMIVSQKKDLKEYAEKNHIKYIESPLGTLVEIQNEGVGPKADCGKYAKLMYKGALLSGKVFDTNIGADAKHKDPLDIAVGTVGTPQSMIQGLDDAMRYFGKGGKGRLLIPAVLAYGDRANEMIPANSNLVFDIEVLDVTTAAPKSATPDMANPKK